MNDQQHPRVLWSKEHAFVEEDCARTITALEPIRINRNIPLWERSPTLHQASLPGENTLLFNPFTSTGAAVLNRPAMAVLQAYGVAQELKGNITLQLAMLGLIRPQLATPVAPRLQPDTLTAWLHVTNACNLSCTYCYVNKNAERMDETTGRAAVEAVFRSALQHGFKTVKLKYAGGEATLNFQLIQSLHRYAQTLAASSGLALREVVLSNGVALSNPILDFIRDSGISLTISLDGLGSEHDAQRLFANGRGSFKLVAWGIERAITRGIQPHLTITVTGRSVDGIARPVAFAMDRDLPFNLNFYRDNDTSGDRAALQAEDRRLIAAMRAAFAVIEARLPRRSLIGALVDRANFGGSHTHTCGAGHSYMVIDHRGRLARCQMEIEKTVADVYAADPLLSLQSVSSGFQNISVDEKDGCRSCEWRYWCSGGCPLLTYRVTGRSDVKSPYCNVYQALYPEVLRLEGLRLLKWHSGPVPLH